MSLANTNAMFRRANEQKYAIGAFNVCNMELIQGISKACFETKSPVIFQISAGAKRYAGRKFLSEIVKIAVEETGIEAALHLDHGNSLELCKECIDNGFTSVMIDASHLPISENIQITQQVVEYAQEKNVSVEAELGQLVSYENHKNDSNYTDPEQACEFILKTKINSLAVAVGTSHGAYKFKNKVQPFLRFDIIEKIRNMIPDFPLVLHGASSVDQNIISQLLDYGTDLRNAKGVPEGMLKKAAKTAICKMNIDTDLRLSAFLALKKFLSSNPNGTDPRSYFETIRDSVKNTVIRKIKGILGSENKAVV
ncbi:MAG: ketose-bisphosphate aldolase [Oscillospiraceae bacterium]|jgi:fructose-bisphosphate aldolase class II|nr:ketose-bisphosphate aldolase [Oscillospiraceae bacterium]